MLNVKLVRTESAERTTPVSSGNIFSLRRIVKRLFGSGNIIIMAADVI